MLSRAAKPTKFAKLLTPDSLIPTIEASESASPELLRRARKVSGSFSWVAPEQRSDYELKWLSEAALKDLELQVDESPETIKEFSEILSGYRAVIDHDRQIYPYAQNYAGDQFGSWAGQLGDGRAMTLFKVGNFEIQLKGGGLTPYSRFADGKAVLRSSIREAIVSEFVNKIGIPTQRCLSLVSFPSTLARRERPESCAVIARMAPSWVRVGTFQLHHSRGDRKELRKLADYCIEELHLGEKSKESASVTGNRYFHLFRDCALLNAHMMARCQSFGFLNGVLNTDNVSVLGLSMDYGPFAFMDIFDSKFTPNHDDYMGRYSFQSSPVIMWWNCIKLGECLGELIGAGDTVDDPDFHESGINTKEKQTAAIDKATKLIMGVGEEFQGLYESEYQKLMMQRLGIFASEEKDDIALVEDLLRTIQECEIGYNRFFRRLGSDAFINSQGKKDAENAINAQQLLPSEREREQMLPDADAISMVETWIKKYNERKARDPISDSERKERMNQLNPNFVPSNSVLANIIELAERNNWDGFNAVAKMSLDPFAESWEGVPEIFTRRYLQEIPLSERDSQLSCSS